jgi:hypothetical protein
LLEEVPIAAPKKVMLLSGPIVSTKKDAYANQSTFFAFATPT